MNMSKPKADSYMPCVAMACSTKWENWYSHLQINMYCTLKCVNQCASYQWELKKQYATPQWVNNKMILPVFFRMYNLLHFQRSYVVWRDSTAQYNVVNHPFFVFHSKPVDCSNFGKTFKIY